MDDLKAEELEILEQYGFDQAQFDDLRARYLQGELSPENNLEKGSIEPPPKNALIHMPERDTPDWARLEGLGREEIGKGGTALVILNGGMATRFGGVVKGVVPVIRDISFLQLKIEHTMRVAAECGGKIPVLLMNSWATHQATVEHLEAHDYFGMDRDQVYLFNQFLHPRLNDDGTIYRDEAGKPSFYGPGHGDFPIALKDKGALAWLQDHGVNHILMANVDNLGARIEPVVIGFHLEQGVQSTVEVAPKWPGDQGGCPVLVDGHLQVVEGFRFPSEFDQDQVDVFNCNTFTFRTDAMDREFPFSWFCVKKRVGKDEIVQFERLVGQVTDFMDCSYLVVPRTGRRNRFYPVKTPRDLEEGSEVIKLLYPEVAGEEQAGS